jgi:hypothetical protein
MMITWSYRADDVYITGDFVDPPWQHQIPLRYSRLLQMYYTHHFIENELPPNIYKLKFIVDGEWLVNGDLPIS